MWGDLVGNSLLTDEEIKRLASNLEPWLISFEQVRAAGLEAERIYRFAENTVRYAICRSKAPAAELVLCEGAEITLWFCFTGWQPLFL